MVWWRRNQAYARSRMSHSTNPIVHFVSGKLTAFSWLGSLGHFDLELVGICQVVGSYAKTTRGYLLDR